MRKWMLLLVFTPSVIFPLAAFSIALRNLSNFQFPAFFSALASATILFTLAVSVITLLLRRRELLRDNAHGLLLLFLFTTGYFLLAHVFNKLEVNTNNVYFEADNWSWLRRMALEDGKDLGIRAAHPFVHILFRPLNAILSTLALGNQYETNLFILSFTGGGCVFLAWQIIKKITTDEINAILFASLLGFSSSHLVFSGVVETYIFSSFFLLLFIWLLLSQKPAYLLLVVGITTFGITITNIIQQGLTIILLGRNLKRTIVLFSFVISIGIGLNILSKFIYPVTEYVFLPENLAGEQEFQKEVTLKRAGLMIENLIIYNIAAPEPYTSVRNEMIRFNFLNGTISQYKWFGWPALVLWLVVFIMAFFYFLKNIWLNLPSVHLSVAMLACLIFNYILHISYGVEPFLYSPDWTYALVIFTAINLSKYARQNWFNFVVFLLVSSVFVNNMWFLYLVTRKISEYLR